MRGLMKWKELSTLPFARLPTLYLNSTPKRSISRSLHSKQENATVWKPYCQGHRQSFIPLEDVFDTREKLYQWLHREHQAGSNVSTAEILNYLQNELDGEEMTMSPGPQFQNQLPPQQQQQQLLMSNQQAPAGGYSGLGHVGRMGTPVDQSKISVFTGALSSPNRRCLPPFGIVQGGYGTVNVAPALQGGRRPNVGMEQHHEAAHEEQESPTSTQTQTFNSTSHPPHTNSVNSVYGYNPPPGQHRDSQFGENDSSMDMHADGGSEEYYR